MSLRMICSGLWLRSDENDGRRPVHSRPVVHQSEPRPAARVWTGGNPGAIGAFRVHTEPSQPAPRAPEKGAVPMRIHTPVCELLGIDHPIVSAPMAADPRLPAAVSNAGALGTVGLWWVDDAGALVHETAALT